MFSPSIARTPIPAVLLAALCASAEPNGYVESVEKLRAELEPQKLIDVVVAFVRWFLRPLRGLATFPQRTWLGYEAW